MLGDPGHQEMVALLKRLGTELTRPDLILVVSAHWEENPVGITTGEQHSLLYDYYGFPPESYEIEYPAPAWPELAANLVDFLTQQGMPAGEENKRGLDHGVFVPLKLIFPNADIPVAQVSLRKGLDPVDHLEMGEALTLWSDKQNANILLIGSGFSFHNLAWIFQASHPTVKTNNRQFADWLVAACGAGPHPVPAAKRPPVWRNWEQAPGARFCHPREEHLLPALVCASAAGYRDPAEVFEPEILGLPSVCVLW